jgi:phage-related baseplate assembly protein
MALSAVLSLDLLPAFQLVEVDFDAERAALLAGFIERCKANGFDYDVSASDFDPVIPLIEEFADRRCRGLEALNDAGKRLSLATAYGAALDHIAATYYADVGVARQAIVANPRPYLLFPQDWESDDRFRRRIQLAPDARTAGTLGSYEYHALTAAPFLIDAQAFNYASGLCRPGEVLVVVLGKDPNPDPNLDVPAQDEAAQLALAQNALLDRDIKEATDIVRVIPATRVPVTISAVLGLPPGPDPAVIVSAARSAVSTYAADAAAHIAREMTESGQKAALYVGGVRRVRLIGTPEDVDPGPTGVLVPTIGSITTEIFNG